MLQLDRDELHIHQCAMTRRLTVTSAVASATTKSCYVISSNVICSGALLTYRSLFIVVFRVPMENEPTLRLAVSARAPKQGNGGP